MQTDSLTMQQNDAVTLKNKPAGQSASMESPLFAEPKGVSSLRTHGITNDAVDAPSIAHEPRPVAEAAHGCGAAAGAACVAALSAAGCTQPLMFTEDTKLI